MTQDEGKYAVPLLLVLSLIAESNKNKRAIKMAPKNLQGICCLA